MMTSSGLKAKEVPFDSLVAQAYDGASNMTGRHHRLQAIIREYVGDHVIFIHCHVHTLNLVLPNTTTTSLQVSQLFNDLRKIYNIFLASHNLSMNCSNQREMGLEILSNKRINTVRWNYREFINTVRWNYREFSLHAFINRYDCCICSRYLPLLGHYTAYCKA